LREWVAHEYWTEAVLALQRLIATEPPDHDPQATEVQRTQGGTYGPPDTGSAPVVQGHEGADEEIVDTYSSGRDLVQGLSPLLGIERPFDLGARS
jgi:hypothetical protein